MATEPKPPSDASDVVGQPVSKPVTHARAIDTAPSDDGHAGTPSVADRVAHIVGMMSRLEWSRGRSAQPLADLWGLKLGTVEKHAGEASRIVKADLDKEEIGRDVAVIAREALLAAKLVNDFRGIKAMSDVLLDISGARAPTKVESTNLNANAEATPEQASRLVREQFGEHAARKVKPDASEPGDLSANPAKP